MEEYKSNFSALALGEDSFVKPNEFIPERWTTRPDLIKDPSAFFAWGSGSSSLAHLLPNLVIYHKSDSLITMQERMRVWAKISDSWKFGQRSFYF